MPRVILLTGAVGAGKSTVLAELAARCRRRWRLAGCVAEGQGRKPDGPAARYLLRPAAGGSATLWAERRAEGGFAFHPEALAATQERLGLELSAGAELVFLDELGHLEAAGEGLSPALRQVADSQAGLLLAAVRRERLEEIVARHGLSPELVVDLDQTPVPLAWRILLREIRALDSERIGLFAGLGGLVEVGLGSVLHAWHVPFKGHALAYLQNLTLASFGKSLHGRGLVRISLIEALLKAFSPMGARLMPMLYIFSQGAVFAGPVALLGWNLPAVLLGSVLMAWFTLMMWLGVKYITYGQGFLDGLDGMIATVGGWFGATWTLGQGLFWLLGLKAALALLVALLAWFGDWLPALRRRLAALSSEKVKGDAPQGLPLAVIPPPASRPAAGWPLRLRGALRDLLRRRFLLAFFISLLFILFFARMDVADLGAVALRGLCLSYLGFLLVRSVDAQALAHWLDRKAGLDVAASLPKALEVLRQGPDDAR